MTCELDRSDFIKVLGAGAIVRLSASKRRDFLLTMTPIPIVGGTGSPINRIVTF